ncbi:MAG: Tfp pilus assembly protein FimT/FimU [Proteobacteria bacterium]|nr:Tfp pilus assembly protein FimT/FimU [Pseudomonadota bacterium]
MDLVLGSRALSGQHGPWQQGFTLIELMVVLVVIAILAAVATPSFVGFIQANRLTARASAFAADLQLARSEAVKRGQPVTVCASNDGTRCSGANIWQAGWIVFLDVAGDRQIDSNAGDIVLRVQPAWTSNDTFTASNGVGAITYSRDGFALNLPAQIVTLTIHTTPANASATRCVTVSNIGRQQVQTPSTSGNCI